MRWCRRCCPSNSNSALAAMFSAILLAAISSSTVADAAQLTDGVIATRYEQPIIHGSCYSKQDLTNLTS
jgi:TRAP-type C4-dicarboxylate transport system permease large subunit